METRARAIPGSTLNPESPAPESSRNSARDKLVQTAMRFFAERGTSVPMVEIAAAAGNRNKSAIAYHFEGRAGLIDAVYDQIRSALAPRFDTLLAELEALPARRLTLYEIVLAMNAPFFALYATDPGGIDALKALARIDLDNQEGAGIYRTFLPGVFNRFADLIARVAPEKRIGQLMFHLAHYLMATIHGLALTDRWKEVDFRSDPELMFELLLSYTDYVSGGISASEADRPQVDVERWRRAVQP